MAENEVILRPSADIQLQHTVFPSEFTAGYLAIKDTVSDGFETYLSSNDIEKKSIFAFSGDNLPTNLKFTLGNITFKFDSGGIISSNFNGNAYSELYIEGVKTSEEHFVFSGDHTVYTLYHILSADDFNAINNYITINKKYPDIWVSIRFYINLKTNASGKGGSGDAVLTQMYVSMGGMPKFSLLQKNNNTYQYASATYKKQGGTWSEIPEDEAKAIISSNTIRRK